MILDIDRWLLIIEINAPSFPRRLSVLAGMTSLACNVLFYDYRGYGWSTGVPLASNLIGDMAHVKAQLPALLTELLQPVQQAPALVSAVGSAFASSSRRQSLPPLFVMGRSMGSMAALELARLFASSGNDNGNGNGSGNSIRLAGLLLDSAIASIRRMPPWMDMLHQHQQEHQQQAPRMTRGNTGSSSTGSSTSNSTRSQSLAAVVESAPDPFENVAKAKALRLSGLPMWAIHGKQDTLVPKENAEELMGMGAGGAEGGGGKVKAKANGKIRLELVDGGDHNNLKDGARWHR